MQSFKLMSMVLSTFMVLAFGAFLVPKPSSGASTFASVPSRDEAQDASCMPNDTQWICP